MSQFNTRGGNEAEHGADKAIDRDMSTLSISDARGDINAWFKASLDKEYCIEQIVRYWNSNLQHKDTHTCSADSCTCEGWRCHYYFPLTVYHEKTVLGENVPSGCKLGDTVRIERRDRGERALVYEIVITAKLGRL